MRPGDAGPAVALVSMPFATLTRPSMALGLLQGVLRRDGMRCKSFYLNLDFAEAVGTKSYHLGTHLGPTEFLVGDWAFAEAAFGADAPEADLYLACLARAWRGGSGQVPAQAQGVLRALRYMRGAAAAFTRRAAEQVLAWRPTIVGCTTSLEQTVASLALLREIKRRDPSVVTMLGGANCETRMGLALHKAFPWVDYLVSGEADGLLPGLCRQIHAGEPGTLAPGVLGPEHRRTGHPRDLPRALERDLDALPDPEFDDYFIQLCTSKLAPVVRPGLPVETSRGCWWGARHPCTFCGLNGSSMGYRSRQADAVVEALDRQVQRYGVKRLYLVDNILDHGYLKTVIPAMKSRKYELFCEIKANLRSDQVQALKDAGVVWLQPGVESLHSEHLRLMDKGIQGWQNLALIRQCRELGIRLSWLLLWGLPGEHDGWFAEVARLVPFLEHLQPPVGLVRVRFDRYSVYHSRAAEFGLNLEPVGSLRLIYPLGDEDLRDLAYGFRDRDDPDAFSAEPVVGHGFRTLDERPGVRELVQAVTRWKKAHAGDLPPLLHVEEDGDTLRFLDSRRVATEARFSVHGAERALYLACEGSPRRDALPGLSGLEPLAADVALAGLVQRGVVLELDGRVLPLALRGDVPPLPGRHDYPGGHLVADLPPASSERSLVEKG